MSWSHVFQFVVKYYRRFLRESKSLDNFLLV